MYWGHLVQLSPLTVVPQYGCSPVTKTSKRTKHCDHSESDTASALNPLPEAPLVHQYLLEVFLVSN